MTGPAQQQPTFYRPAEVAAMLRCSEWWVKEQARNRRIPYCWIGGSYRFTPGHVVEIARLFEVRPAEDVPSPRRSGRSTQLPKDNGAEPPLRLVARRPRRAQSAASEAA